MGEVDTLRHKALSHSGACSSTASTQDSVSNSAKDTGPRPSQQGAMARILTARKRINLRENVLR